VSIITDQKIKDPSTKNVSILWLSFTMLDLDLHKNALLQVVKELSNTGNKPTVFALRSKYQVRNENQSQIIAIPIRYVPVLSPIFFMIITTLYLPFYLLYSKPNFIIFEPDTHIMSSFLALIISKFTKTKIILDIRTVIVEKIGLRGALRSFWFTVSILIAKRFFDGLTIITRPMKKQLSLEYGLQSKKIGIWTSGVSEKLFKPDTQNRLTFRRKYRLTDRFVVFYHGTFTASRALKETIEAIKILVPKHPDILLFLLGSGPSLPVLKKAIEYNNLKEYVIINEPVDQKDVPKFISISDVGIIPLPDHPYWRFQSPLKLLEYLSMEKVTILTDIVAHRDVIGNDKCGIFISSVNPHEIARAIEFAYINRQYLSDWGKAGRKIVFDHYSWAKVSNALKSYLINI
jgi:glycosyltransferase involved in cell wall biosynthesis